VRLEQLIKLRRIWYVLCSLSESGGGVPYFLCLCIYYFPSLIATSSGTARNFALVVVSGQTKVRYNNDSTSAAWSDTFLIGEDEFSCKGSNSAAVLFDEEKRQETDRTFVLQKRQKTHLQPNLWTDTRSHLRTWKKEKVPT